MVKGVQIAVVACVVLLLTGCNGCNKNKSRQKPDVSDINIRVQLLRFDKDLSSFDAGQFDAWRQGMQNRYGDFYRFYIGNFVIGPRPPGDTADIEREALQRFVTDSYIRTIQDSINARYANTQPVEGELAQMFRYFKYYFPEFEVPQVIGINSAYGAGVSPFGKAQLVVGLDMFLGTDNRDYDSVGIYNYLRHKMTPAYIPRYAAEALYAEYSPPGTDDQNLLEAMIDAGKKLYVISYLFPDAPDSLILGYTGPQTEWCTASEDAIWKFFNDKDLLYKSNAMDKSRYLGEGPTTTGMPPEAPGGIGNFVGLQVVRSFMQQTGGEIPLREMVLNYPPSVILQKAKYRPAKSKF